MPRLSNRADRLARQLLVAMQIAPMLEAHHRLVFMFLGGHRLTTPPSVMESPGWPS